MRKVMALLVLGALLTACSSAPSPTPPPPVQTPNGDSQPAQMAKPQSEPSGTPTKLQAAVAGLNDQSFQFAKESNWAEAERTAKEALTLNPESVAGHFNLGKALMGAGRPAEAVRSFRNASWLTKGANVDVQYNLAKALYVVGDQEGALKEAQDGVQRFPTDPDFPTLLAQIQTMSQGKLWAEVDLDGDGLPESFRETAEGIQVSSKGTVIFKGPKLGTAVYQVTPLTMPDGTVLVHVQWHSCPTYGQNELLWYNPAAGKIQDAAPTNECTTYEYDGKGNFTSWHRIFPLAIAVVNRWERGALISAGSKQTLYGKVSVDEMDWILGEIASTEGEIEGAEQLFASPDLYQRFRRKTAGSRWTFTRVGLEMPLKLTVERDKQRIGTILVQMEKDLITDLSWPPAP